jgi:hypothetical protein
VAGKKNDSKEKKLLNMIYANKGPKPQPVKRNLARPAAGQRKGQC